MSDFLSEDHSCRNAVSLDEVDLANAISREIARPALKENEVMPWLAAAAVQGRTTEIDYTHDRVC
jgi:hypothetical protein